jgi:hypothetical protein
METFSNKKVAKSSNEYVCDICDYITSRRCNYNKHISSSKHKFQSELSTIVNNCQPKVAKSSNYLFYCDFCNKQYKERTGLWRHKQKCNKINNDEKTDNNMTDLVLELVKQNSEFKELLTEQNKYIIEQNKQNQSLQNQLIEIAKDKSMNNCHNTNNINNTTNNNNHFNLQFFLNETCKDAMNMNEFIEQIPLRLSDLEDTARLGYAEGISRIFVRGLKQLEVNQRPIHCSDAKRETLYIKDGNIWEKDDTNKSKLTNAIKRVAQKNMKQIPEWKKEHPHCQDSSSRKNDLYLNIVSNAMSGSTDEEAEHNYSKIKKNIIKEVIINK